MSDTLSLLLGHHSDRSFRDDPVDGAVLDEIVAAAHQAPTSHNAQHVSLVIVQDAETRRHIAAIAGGQPHIAQAPVFIAVIIDFAKTGTALALHGKEQQVHHHLEGLVAGSVDVGIQIATLMIAARASGLGAVPIGGIRNDLAALNTLLALPQGCTAVTGLCIGHVDQPAAVKPRLDLSTYRHDERYSDKDIAPAIVDYDNRLAAHWAAIGRTEGESWSASIAEFYDHDYYPGVAAAFAAQGLFTEKE